MNNFAQLGICEPLLRAVADAKYDTPTPIQSAAIPEIVNGRDLLGCAQTGTGKTAAFALPLLHRLHVNRRGALPNEPRVLVLSPTRELAAQIGANFHEYGRHLRIRHTVIFGGVGQRPQVTALDRGVHVLVATPGRLLDLMQQGYVQLSRVEAFVLDEADRMLDMGFMPDLRRIVAELPTRRQSLFFSATMPTEVLGLAERLLTDPVRISVAPSCTTAERVEQQVLHVAQNEKLGLLRQLLRDEALEQILVFTRTKRRADMVSRNLRDAGITTDVIHGNKSQNARQRALEGFRRGRTRVLVATDIAARGLDVDGVSHVINFDLPQEPEGYVHRIGRTGRAGASGTAFSFCDHAERPLLRDIERAIGKALPSSGNPEPATAREPRSGGSRSGAPRTGGGRRAGAPRAGGPRPGAKGPGKGQRQRTARAGGARVRSR